MNIEFFLFVYKIVVAFSDSEKLTKVLRIFIKMQNIKSFLKANSPISMLLRMNHGKHNKKYLYKDGKLVGGNIYYYPR